MLPASRRLVRVLPFLMLACIPATAAAQAPTYLTQWSTGIGFSGIATDAVGDVYITGSYGAQVFKFTGTGTPLTQWHTLWAPDEYLGGPMWLERA